MTFYTLYVHKKSLRTPKGQSEVANRRKTDNVAVKRKNNDPQNITQKTKDFPSRTP